MVVPAGLLEVPRTSPAPKGGAVREPSDPPPSGSWGAVALMTGKCLLGPRPWGQDGSGRSSGLSPPPPVRLSSLPPAFLAPMMETLKASTEQWGGGVQKACVPTPPPSLDSHGQIPGLMGDARWAASLPLRKWDSEPANQRWGMPGEGVARRPRGSVVRNRLWVQGWAFPLPSCVALGSSYLISLYLSFLSLTWAHS